MHYKGGIPRGHHFKRRIRRGTRKRDTPLSVKGGYPGALAKVGPYLELENSVEGFGLCRGRSFLKFKERLAKRTQTIRAVTGTSFSKRAQNGTILESRR